MPLILAIEPDHRQASQLRAMARGRLGADLVHADSAEPALIALAGRVPDLILMPALLSPADEAAIGDYLRVLDAASSHVQTLIIPVLAANRPRSRRRGVLASLKRQQAPAHEGCDPKEFAEQCATYLERAAAERQRRAEADAYAAVDALAVEPAGESIGSPAGEALVEYFAEPQAPLVIAAPAVEAHVEFDAELHAPPVIDAPVVERNVEFFADLHASPAIEAPVVDAHVEFAAELHAPPVIEAPVVDAHVQFVAELHAPPVIEAPVVDAHVQFVAEASVVEALEAPARKLEFIDLDLSTLVEELSGPNLAIPAEAPSMIAALENSAPPPAPVAVRETTSPAPSAAAPVKTPPAARVRPPAAAPVKMIELPVEVVEKPVAPAKAAIKWTAVYSPPGRSWPSMEGVAAETGSAASASLPRKAAESAAARNAAPKAVQDEWGFFDPARCGFTALLSKLDEITTDEGPLKQGA